MSQAAAAARGVAAVPGPKPQARHGGAAPRRAQRVEVAEARIGRAAPARRPRRLPLSCWEGGGFLPLGPPVVPRALQTKVKHGTRAAKATHIPKPELHKLGPPVVPFSPLFAGEGSPTKEGAQATHTYVRTYVHTYIHTWPWVKSPVPPTKKRFYNGWCTYPKIWYHWV